MFQRAVMLVAEASVDENHLATARKNQIRPTGQALPMEAIARVVRQTARQRFGSNIAAPDRTHYPAAYFRGFRHCLNSIRRLGSVSTASMIAL